MLMILYFYDQSPDIDFGFWHFGKFFRNNSENKRDKHQEKTNLNDVKSTKYMEKFLPH